MWQHFEIQGTGSYLPGAGVSAAEIEERGRLPDGWIAQHTQVSNRYECARPETLATMARQAIQRAMDDANVTWKEIDLLIDCSTSRHQPIPCNGAILQSLFLPESDGVPVMDIHGTCLGFMLALNVVNALFGTGAYQRVLLVASEATLAAANWNEPESSTLLSDGAAALVLQKREPTPTFYFRHVTYSKHISECQVLGGGHSIPAFEYTVARDDSFRFHMEGPRLFRTALRHLPPLVEQLINESQTPRDAILFVPHQASPHAVEAVRRRLKVSPENFINRAAVLGNMASASIPVVFDQLRRDCLLRTGQPAMFLGTSAGFSQAGLLFTP